MWIGVVTAMPQLITAGLSDGVVGRAVAKDQLDIELFNVRDHATDSYGSIDDHPFGGAPGMLMMAEPLAACTEEAISKSPARAPKTIYLSPQGNTLTQAMVRELSQLDAMVLVSARYEGVDERYIEEYVDFEISVGDYVLSGGELPVLLVIDAIGRLVKGTLGNEKSADDDSFGDNLLEGPQFTRPREWRGKSVPSVLTSGDHAAVARWRHEQALLRTWQRRPELLTDRRFNSTEKAWLKHHVNKKH
ncbi:MAG: tRNA (guanosine(37)-N1)-methyltransferase TrmD [Gammaproteobacteria bacterium]|nr:tRNA (guanosine(37)-N1)-methyltransferase TrmD [Gammaproteobacteria bacterium]